MEIPSYTKIGIKDPFMLTPIEIKPFDPLILNPGLSLPQDILSLLGVPKE